ncbi:uncharacterized protein PG986_006543 [Apiospora aurea]|uniref:Uncharacterized protein n=1 Tax=Apiospora aurea TaxID=335848 RepID=A0ABR1QKQ4_9PEZI
MELCSRRLDACTDVLHFYNVSTASSKSGGSRYPVQYDLDAELTPTVQTYVPENKEQTLLWSPSGASLSQLAGPSSGVTGRRLSASW